MKKSALTLVALAAGALVLTGCTSSEKETLNEAAQFCIDNWGTHEIVTSETAVYGECTLPDGTVCDEWDYFEGICPNNEEYPSSYIKTSLTLEDIEQIEETLAPLSYSYNTIDKTTEQTIDEWTYTAPEGENKLTIPEYDTMISREVLSSSIEDHMIYTLTNLTQEDGKVISVLYINDPETLFCRAISVETDEKVTLYNNFIYNADITEDTTSNS